MLRSPIYKPKPRIILAFVHCDMRSEDRGVMPTYLICRSPCAEPETSGFQEISQFIGMNRSLSQPTSQSAKETIGFLIKTEKMSKIPALINLSPLPIPLPAFRYPSYIPSPSPSPSSSPSSVTQLRTPSLSPSPLELPRPICASSSPGPCWSSPPPPPPLPRLRY